jgi:2-keto-3-deoxy-L-rhamnonate aldolase RhmA
VKFTNERLVVMAQIETARGLERSEAIARAKGVDMLFYGPGDMSLSLGVPPGSPALAEAMARIAKAAHGAGKLFGTFVASAEDAERAVAVGARLLVFGGDGSMLLAGARDASAMLRRVVGAG